MGQAIYKPLNPSKREIRLLRINPPMPDIPEEHIRCQLYTVSLDDHPRYHALSYVWGNPDDKKPISVNYELFFATANLYAALRRIRRKDEDAIFWIDAICINQDDLAERSSQVMLMGAIYSGAEIVRAWVGEKDDTSDAAMDIIEKWTRNMDAPLAAVGNLTDYVYSETLKGDYNAAIEELCQDRIQRSVGTFFGGRRPYWERLWIIQELILAKDTRVTCGQREIGFHKIVYFHKKLSILKNVSQRMGLVGKFPAAAHIFYQPPSVMTALANDRSLLGLTNFSRACQATDPRDRLYGLLGLAEPVSYTPVPDYTKPVGQVYAEFTSAYYKATGRLLVDGTSGIGYYEDQSVIPDMPSWAFNLTKSVGLEVHVAGAGTGRAATLRDTNDPTVLETQGIIVDTIKANVCCSEHDTDHMDFARFVLDHVDGEHPTGIPLAQAFFRTLGTFDKRDVEESHLGADNFYRKATGFILWLNKYTQRMGRTHPKWDDFCEIFFTESFGYQGDLHILLDELSNHSLCFLESTGLVDHLYEPCERLGGLQAMLTMEHEEILAGFCGRQGGDVLPWRDLYWRDDDTNFHTWSTGLIVDLHYLRCLFITQTGYVGVGPPGTADGDEVCVLPSCEYPLVVRRRGETYQVVGPCRAYGLMDGEMIKKLDKRDVRLKELKFV